MTAESVRHSELINQLVLNRSTMAELGRVEVLWEYPQAHRVFGFIAKSGAFDRQKAAFNLDQLETIGPSGVFVNSDPVETDADRVKQIETLIGSEVWTDMGNRMGRITDHVFDIKTGAIKVYLFVPGGLKRFAGPVYALYPSQVLGWGSHRVVVSAGIVDQLEVYEPGMQDRINRFADVLNDEASQAGQGLQSVLERAKRKAKQARSQAQILADRAIDKAQELGGELLESAEYARDQARNLRDELMDEDFDQWRRNDDRDDSRYDGRYDGRYDDRGRDDDRRYENGNDDFDFDEPWDEPRPERWADADPSPPRAPLNLEPKPTTTKPAPTDRPKASPPKTDRPTSDPWDEDWD
jgi:uncharacterized protein YrrD